MKKKEKKKKINKIVKSSYQCGELKNILHFQTFKKSFLPCQASLKYVGRVEGNIKFFKNDS